MEVRRVEVRGSDEANSGERSWGGEVDNRLYSSYTS